MQDVDLSLDGPSQEVAAGQFRLVVTPARLRLAVCIDGSVQHTRHASAWEAGVHFHSQALFCEAVENAQYAKPPPACRHIAGEINRPPWLGAVSAGRDRNTRSCRLRRFLFTVSPSSRYSVFERTLEAVRVRYGFVVAG